MTTCGMLVEVTAWHLDKKRKLVITEHVMFTNEPFQFDFKPIALSIHVPEIDLEMYEMYDDYDDDEEE